MKQETLERIKQLHIKCGFLDTEHLFMIPKTRLEYVQYEEFYVEITDNLYNTNCTPKSFLLRNILRVGIPKSTVLVIIVRVFIRHISLMNEVPIVIIHLKFPYMVLKKQDHLIKAR